MAELKGSKTHQNLKDAFAGESMANRRYLYFAKVADVEVGCTLMIEIEDPVTRDQKLREWWDLPGKIYLLLENGDRVHATFDERQRGDGRLSSVQYLKFDAKGQVPVAAGVDLPGLQTEAPLTNEQRQALYTDLGGDT